MKVMQLIVLPSPLVLSELFDTFKTTSLCLFLVMLGTVIYTGA